MTKNKDRSSKSKHKETLTKLRIKKLEEKMKMNLIKRKKGSKKKRVLFHKEFSEIFSLKY